MVEPLVVTDRPGHKLGIRLALDDVTSAVETLDGGSRDPVASERIGSRYDMILV